MSDAPRLRTLSGITYEQTEAQWAVDNRIFGSNVQLVPVDGADQGKHKLGNGINTYAELGFVEDGGASTSVKVDGMAQSGIAAFTATLGETGETAFNLTALIPGVTSAYMISAATTGSTAVTASVNGSTLSAFTVAFGTVPDLNPPNGETIICTFAYKL